MRSETRRYSLDQIGLAIGAAGDQKSIGNNMENIPSTNASETTPKNSIQNEKEDKVQQPAQPKKRISKDADCVKIDYEDLGIIS